MATEVVKEIKDAEIASDEIINKAQNDARQMIKSQEEKAKKIIDDANNEAKKIASDIIMQKEEEGNKEAKKNT